MYSRNVATYLSNIKKFNTVTNIGKKYEEKFKGTIVEKWIKYWKNLYTDYKEVAIDIRKDVKEKPIKAIGILSTFAFLGFCAKTNPDDTNFRDAVLKASNEILLVSPTQRRPDAVEHLRLLEKCYNANIIRRLSFGVFSVMWVDNYSALCNTYECTCSYLELSYIDFFKRIIDVGFINKWWLLEKRMEDFDVNY